MNDSTFSSTIAALPGAAAALLTDWAKQGAQSFVATQKILFDLGAQQNSLALGYIRERASYMPFGTATGMVEFAGHNIANFIAAQKILLDLAARENALLLDASQDGLSLPAPAAAVADVICGGVDALIAMQNKFLDLFAEQSRATVKGILDGAPLDGATGMAQRAQAAFETFVDTQKKFLDLLAKQVSPQPSGRGGKPSKARARKKLTDLAKDGIDAFAEAEKQLVVLAAAHVSATLDAARPKAAEPSTTLGEVARRSLVNFVNAQKALLDVAAKPFLPAPPPAPRAAARRR